VDHIQVGLLAVSADVVDFTGPALFQYRHDRPAMVLHVQPVADVGTIPIDRYFPAVQRMVNHQRNELFRELVGPVIVGAVGGQGRQAIGVMIGPDQMVRPRLGCRIGAVGRIGRGFRERRIIFLQGAVHLVGGHVQESKCGSVIRCKALPVVAHLLEQVEGADQVGLDEIIRRRNGSIHMALGGKVDDRPRMKLDPAALQPAAGRRYRPLQRCGSGFSPTGVQILGVAGVGQFVQVDDTMPLPVSSQV
jgi:hypothetical protein